MTSSLISFAQRWSERDLQTMAERLDVLVAPAAEIAPDPTSASVHEGDLGSAEDTALPPGWRAVTMRDGWKPAPIGVHVG